MNNRYLPNLLTVLLAAVLLITVTADAWGCPTCKNGLGEEASHIVNGYFWSIIFMMSMPFLIFTGLSLYFYVLVVRARMASRQAGPAAAKPAFRNQVSVKTMAEILETPPATLPEYSVATEEYSDTAAEETRELVEV